MAAFVGAVLLFGTLGQEFVPTLDEQDIAAHAMRISSTSLTQSLQMQWRDRKDAQRVSGGGPGVFQNGHG